MQKKQSGLRGWIRTIADIAVIVLIVLAAKTAIAEPFYVPSGSMEPTLLIGDELLAMKYPYGYIPSLIFCFPQHAACLLRAPKARRRCRLPLARRSLAGLGQARDRPAG